MALRVGAGNRAVAKLRLGGDRSSTAQRQFEDEFDAYGALIRRLEDVADPRRFVQRGEMVREAQELESRLEGSKHPDARQLRRWLGALVQELQMQAPVSPDAEISLPGRLLAVAESASVYDDHPGWSRGTDGDPIKRNSVLVPGDVLRELPNTYTLLHPFQAYNHDIKRNETRYRPELRERNGFSRVRVVKPAADRGDTPPIDAGREVWVVTNDLNQSSAAFAAPRWGVLDGATLYAEGGPAAHDPVQGLHGDCYLISQLASIAHDNPQLITGMIRESADDTYSVRFFHADGGGFLPVWIRITKTIVVNSVDYLGSDGVRPMMSGTPLLAGGGTLAPLWPAVIEKAYAVFRGGYPQIEGGSAPAMEHLLGRPAEQIDIDSDPPAARRLDAADTDRWLRDHGLDVAAVRRSYDTHEIDVFRIVVHGLEHGQIPTLGTPSELKKEGLAGEHGYSVLGWGRGPKGRLYLLVRNPWNVHGMAPLTRYQLHKEKKKRHRHKAVGAENRKPDPDRPVFELDLNDVVRHVANVNLLK